MKLIKILVILFALLLCVITVSFSDVEVYDPEGSIVTEYLVIPKAKEGPGYYYYWESMMREQEVEFDLLRYEKSIVLLNSLRDSNPDEEAVGFVNFKKYTFRNSQDEEELLNIYDAYTEEGMTYYNDLKGNIQTENDDPFRIMDRLNGNEALKYIRYNHMKDFMLAVSAIKEQLPKGTKFSDVLIKDIVGNGFEFLLNNGINDNAEMQNEVKQKVISKLASGLANYDPRVRLSCISILQDFGIEPTMQDILKKAIYNETVLNIQKAMPEKAEIMNVANFENNVFYPYKYKDFVDLSNYPYYGANGMVEFKNPYFEIIKLLRLIYRYDLTKQLEKNYSYTRRDFQQIDAEKFLTLFDDTISNTTPVQFYYQNLSYHDYMNNNVKSPLTSRQPRKIVKIFIGGLGSEYDKVRLRSAEFLNRYYYVTEDRVIKNWIEEARDRYYFMTTEFDLASIKLEVERDKQLQKEEKSTTYKIERKGYFWEKSGTEQ